MLWIVYEVWEGEKLMFFIVVFEKVFIKSYFRCVGREYTFSFGYIKLEVFIINFSGDVWEIGYICEFRVGINVWVRDKNLGIISI